MRYFIRVVLALACLVGAVPVSADMVGQWQNQAGQIIEVRPDGQVQKISDKGLTTIFHQVTGLFSPASQRQENWEYAAAGQGFSNLRQEGLTDQSDWTQERILDKSAPLSEFRLAVYYRLKPVQDDQSLAGQEGQSSTLSSVKTTTLSNQERQVPEPEQAVEDSEEEAEPVLAAEEQMPVEAISQSEEEIQEEKLIVQSDEPAEEESSPVQEPAKARTSSFGQRSSRTTGSNRSTGKSQSNSTASKKKDTQEELPKANAENGSVLRVYGYLLLILPIVKCSNYLIKKFNPVIIKLKKTL